MTGWTVSLPTLLACRSAFPRVALQVPALAVVQTTWKAQTETGWDHPAWREAYSLGQLCLAASYTFPEPHAALPAPRSSNIAQDTVNSTPPHQQPCNQGAQTDSLPEPDRLSPHRQGSVEQGSMPQSDSNIGSIELGSMQGDSRKNGSPRQGRPERHSQSQQGRPGNGSLEQGSPEQGSHSMEAMQALDLASIMGAPAEMLAPLLTLIEPIAKQAHQASLAQHHNHVLHPAQQSDSINQANPLPQQQSGSMQQNQHASPQRDSCQATSASQLASGWTAVFQQDCRLLYFLFL